jgi:hypothetical protein
MLEFYADHSHTFNKIPFLAAPYLLAELKDHCLTMELNDHVPRITGIPPHVENLVQNEQLQTMTSQVITKIDGFSDNLCAAVSDAIDKKVEADGNVNAAILQSSLAGLEQRMIEKMKEELGSGGAARAVNNNVAAVDGIDLSGMHRRVGLYDSFMYRGKFWCVPESFEFPIEVTRLVGWRMWLTGKTVVHNGKTFRIKPFHLLKGTDLPKQKLVSELDTKWKPIFRLMMKAPGIPDTIPSDADENFVQQTFEIATEYLKSTVSYIWAKHEGVLGNYKIGTWSRKVSASEIRKHGTQEDIAKLPPVTARNKTDSRKIGGWTIEKSFVRRVGNVRRRRQRVDPVAVNDDFENAFGGDDIVAE